MLHANNSRMDDWMTNSLMCFTENLRDPQKFETVEECKKISKFNFIVHILYSYSYN